VSTEAVGRPGRLLRLGVPVPHVRAAAVWAYGVVLSTYGALVLVLWLPFGPRNGMPYETAFPYASETTSWLDGFLYQGDALRPYTSVFYHLSYLIGEVTGHTGSFVPYQLVYATLWWGRGVLVFLILAEFFGKRSLVAYLAGVLTLVHASDHALNWVGQMNQFGMMFWLLLSIWLLVKCLLSTRPVRSALWCLGAMLAARACLWSYESALGIVLIVPAALLLVRPSFRTREKLTFAAIYYIVPVYYGVLNLQRYLGGGSSTYQEAVTRHNITIGQLAGDLWFNVRTSVSFWDWGDQMPPVGETGHILGLVAMAVVVVGGLIVYRPDAGQAAPTRRSLIALAVIGALVFVLSFPAYLILTSSRLVWRTQFLSGIGFGVFVAAVIVLAATFLRSRRAQLTVLVGAAVVAFFGAAASYRMADFHYGIWLRHKHAVEEVLEAAPRVRPGTVIVYTGVPATADPFGDAMWFDMALRLAYPHVAVSGVYYFKGGRPAPDEGLTLRRGGWSPTGKGFPPLVGTAPLRHTLFIRYGTRQALTLDSVPRFLVHEASSAEYKPASVVAGSTADARALRRYGPLNDEDDFAR
jgi:hypothetical protein